jgi:hypothetical protein
MRGSTRIKLSIVVFLIFASLYSYAWFYSAHYLKIFLSEFSNDKKNNQISFSIKKISGFPFNLKVKLKDVTAEYKISNIAINKDVKLDLESVTLETNVLFNYIKIILPKKVSIQATAENVMSKYELISNSMHSLEVAENNFINTHRLIEILSMPEIDLGELDLKIKRLDYIIEDLHVFNQVSGKEVFYNTSNTHVYIDRLSNIRTAIKIRAENNVTIIDHDDFAFHNLLSKLKVGGITKANEDTYSLISGDVKKLKLDLDGTEFSLLGSTKDLDSGKLDLSMILKVIKWKNLLDRLKEKEILSYNRYIILNTMIKSITGEYNPTDMEINIHTSKDGFIRVGQTDFSSIKDYFQQFLTSK